MGKDEPIDEKIILQEQADLDMERVEKEMQTKADIDEDYAGMPSLNEKDNFFKLFQKIISTEDSSKVANLNRQEIGMLKHSVRHYQKLALLCDALGQGKVAEYYMKKGEIILATSLSKKAKLLSTIISKIRTSESIRTSSESNTPNKGWKGLFGGDKGKGAEYDG